VILDKRSAVSRSSPYSVDRRGSERGRAAARIPIRPNGRLIGADSPAYTSGPRVLGDRFRLLCAVLVSVKG